MGGLLLLGTGPPEPSRAGQVVRRAVLPLDFVQNRGQWPGQTRFAASKGPLSAALERDAIRLSSLVLRFEGVSKRVRLVGEQRRSGLYNFFLGDDPARWRSRVPAFASVRYHGLYQGVDVRVRDAGRRLEYDLLVAPGADLRRVVVRPRGASRLRIAHDGTLLLRTRAGILRQAPPVAWEVRPDGEQRPLESRFRLLDGGRYGFDAPGHDPRRALVVDPGVDWATFLGGNGDETVEGLAMTSDGSGDVVVAGQTRSPDFQHTGGNLVPTGGTPYVARLNAAGTALVYATFFGGSSNHAVMGLALDAADRPAVVGDTNSEDFPTTPGAFDRTGGNRFTGDYDAYVIKFDPAGGGPLFGTYLAGSPGSGSDEARLVGFDPTGSVIVSGVTVSPDFPTTPGAFDQTGQPGEDSFVSRLDPTGSQLTYSTFVAANVFGMVVDGRGFVTLTGKAGSPFPTTPDAFDATFNGYADAFVARLKLDGAGPADLKYGTFLGGSQFIEAGNGIAVDPSDPELVTISGFTRSGDFPTTPGALLRTHFAPVDTAMGFVARFRFPAAGGGSLVWSTLYGAPGNQSADDVVVDSSGAALIVGGTVVNNPPTTERAFDRIPGAGYGVGVQGKSDGYVARISADGSRLLYSTLLGGRYGDAALHVAYAGGTSVIVAGETNSTDFPVTTGAFDTVYAADGKPSGNATPGTLAADAFVVRFTLEAPVGGDAAPPPAPELRAPAEGAAFDYPGRNLAFDWTEVSDASGVAAYHLQLSPNSTFTNDLTAQLNGWWEVWIPSTAFVFTVDHPGTFYLRVQALDGGGNLGPWSAVRSFTITSATPEAPTLVSPPNNGQFAPGNVTFAWNAAAGADTYQLDLDTRSDFTSSERRIVYGITQLQHTLSLTGEKRYWWRVRGASEVTVGPWSPVWSFAIKTGAAPAPAPPPSPAPGGAVLSSLRLSSSVASAGGAVQGTVALSEAAAAGGASVTLDGNYPGRVSVPATVTVPEGSTSATFAVTVAPSTPSAYAGITGQYGGVTQGASLFVSPNEESSSELNSFTVSKTSLLGGETIQGTVALLYTLPAKSGGALITLGSTNPALASVPASVTIPEGTTTASFAITTQPVTTATEVTILASRSTTVGQTLELLPQGALASLSLSQTIVQGGTLVQGTVTLAGAAPAGGVVVSLASSDTTVATVPASVTVAAGATSATFTIATSSPCCSGTFSIISASAAGITRSVMLHVNPGSTADSVSITRAEYEGAKQTLRIEATSTSSSATLNAYVSSTNELIGTLASNGGGKYSATFSWPVNPQSVTVKSSLGGSATKAVTAK